MALVGVLEKTTYKSSKKTGFESNAGSMGTPGRKERRIPARTNRGSLP